jgi:hypothetical protein
MEKHVCKEFDFAVHNLDKAIYHSFLPPVAGSGVSTPLPVTLTKKDRAR